MKKKATREPAGRCHEWAGRYMLRKGTSGTRLIHGMVTGLEGRRIHHWWIEEGFKVFDPTLQWLQDGWFQKDEYYKSISAEPLEVYTKSETMFLTLSTGHYGPWTSRERNALKGKIFF